MRDFGANLKEAIGRAGYATDAEAARELKIEQRTFANYVGKGRIPQDPEVLTRICRGLGVTPNHLLGFEMPNHQQEAAVIAERLSAANRQLWFRFGLSIIEKSSGPPRNNAKIPRKIKQLKKAV